VLATGRRARIETEGRRQETSMIPIVTFIFFIVASLLMLLRWAIIIHAILSWLVAFEVVNLRNRFAYMVANFLERVTNPVLAPFRRFIPPLGGVDISPIIALLVLLGVERILLPAAQNAVIGMLAGGVVY